MLLQINIQNFALIEKLSISFDEGFNVFSGETGAGKSILVDAINYVLGSKFNRDLIRTGETKAFVEAVFAIDNAKTKAALLEQEIECEDLVIISRETFTSGRSIVKVNGKSMIISDLRKISQTLLDIHGQHENQSLLDSANHISYLDAFTGSELSDLLKAYIKHYQELGDVTRKIHELQGNDNEKEKISNYLKFQIDEIDNAKIKPNEDVELEERCSMLTHAEKISSVLSGTYEQLYNGTEDNSSIYDSLGHAIRELRSIQNHMEKVKIIADSLEEAYYAVEQNVSEIRDLKETVYYDEGELSSINARIYTLNTLKKKYGNSIDEVLAYRDKIRKQYDDMVNSKDVIEELQKKKLHITKELKELSLRLHDIRQASAEILEAKVKDELSYIGLEKSTFRINVDLEEDFGLMGSDKVQFMISTNPGEPLKPLEKVVSGGELSRIMLALKTVFVDKDSIPTVIFDEIDTGISGRIAQSVAEKMFLISNKRQVFCVTHLPQIASMSDSHYLVVKEVENEKTFTNVRRLELKEKEFEIARMIGGSEVTKVTIENSKEIINLANSKKSSIIKNLKKIS